MPKDSGHAGASRRAERQRLAALAGHDDMSWNLLVQLLTPQLDQDLVPLNLPPSEADHLRRAVWRALARRLELRTPPPDVQGWLRQRTVIEAGRRPRLALVIAQAETAGAPGRPTDIPDRRRRADRRRRPRAGHDRRTSERITPDSLAARLRHDG